MNKYSSYEIRFDKKNIEIGFRLFIGRDLIYGLHDRRIELIINLIFIHIRLLTKWDKKEKRD